MFKRLSSGKWEGRRIIDVAADDPKWCKRSAASNVVNEQYKNTIHKALEIIERTGYKPDFSIDDPRSLSIHSRVCIECAKSTETYITKAANVMCFDCYEVNLRA